MRLKRLFCLFLALILLSISCKKKTTISLHDAVKAGDIRQIQLQISNGADINISDDRKQQLLEFAVTQDLKDMVKRLIAKGADINKKNPGGDTICLFGWLLTMGI